MCSMGVYVYAHTNNSFKHVHMYAYTNVHTYHILDCAIRVRIYICAYRIINVCTCVYICIFLKSSMCMYVFEMPTPMPFS